MEDADNPITCIKIGGSVLTDKTKPQASIFREKIAKQLAREFAEYQQRNSKKERFVIIHGAGSFGHPLAKKYRLAECAARKDPRGVAAVRAQVQELSLLVGKAFLEEGCEVAPLTPSSFIRQRNGRISWCDLAPVQSVFKKGAIPLLHGDVVEDEQCDFSICSGDQMLSYLSASALPTQRAIFLTDVDGVFQESPKQNPNAELLANISIKEIARIAKKKNEESAVDVTQAMAGKLQEIARMRCPVVVCNGMKFGVFLRALRGESVGTKIS